MQVNIVIATHDRDQYIRLALDTALAQTYQNTIVTVIDDGSSDASWNIINDYAATYPTLLGIRLQKNYGIGTARNVGLVCRHFDALTFHDSDDSCVAEKIAIQVAELAKPVAINSAIDSFAYPFIPTYREVIWNACYVIQDGQESVSGDPSFMTAQLLPNVFYSTNPAAGFFHTNSGLYRRTVFQQLGGFQKFVVMEDTEFQNRLLLYGCSATFCSQPLYRYQVHTESVTYGNGFFVGSVKRQEIADRVYQRINELADHRFERAYPQFVQPIDLEEVAITAIANRQHLDIQRDIPILHSPSILE